ncbi:MAG TPA: EAL domain-containing protein [Acidimicrobiales bacterium]|nr:EAL domain-containing protein [Acidimicrobiales bacterium]
MRGSSTLTLRRVWVVSVLQLVTVVVGVSGLAVGATWYSGKLFHEAVFASEGQMTSVTSLKSALVEMSIVATPVMYGLNGSRPAEENLSAYTDAGVHLTRELEAAGAVFVNPDSREILSEMVDIWHGIDAAILSAPDLLASGSLAEVVASGLDPFEATIWKPYNEMDRQLSQLSIGAVGELRSRRAAFDRVHDLIVVGVIASLAVALVVSFAAARRVSRRVLMPLSMLRSAAVALSDSRTGEPIVLPGAALELHDLARTINATSIALRATHSELRDQAGTDALTGLPNRRGFTEMLESTLANPANGRVAVLFIDLDDFKIVNDSLGHAAGDELLRVVAHRLRSVTRDRETVARLGGDEFAVMLVSDAASSAAVAIAQRILVVLHDRVALDGTTVGVGASIGLALSPEGSGTEVADELVRNADFAMYMAKSQGKNRFEVFAPTMHAEMLARLALKHELGQAVRLGQFVLAYQPVIEIDTRALLGFEALIRWQHPTRGLLQPAEFIGLAEDTDDIVAIDQWVVDEACGALAEHHRRQSPNERQLWMSVNVSPIEITRPGFAAGVYATLERHGIAPEALIIEVTEGVALTDTGSAIAVLNDLHSAGVHIALDDFGSGFSSLRSLHQLPIDMIKIDRSFLVNNGDDHSLLEGIVTLGCSLGLDIVAEGIETPADLARLTQLGIAGQGYLFARPLSSSAAAEFRRNGTTVTVAHDSPVNETTTHQVAPAAHRGH